MNRNDAKTTRPSAARLLAGMLLALALLTAPAAAQSAPPAPLAGLDDYIRTEMERWRIPGLAIAVVKDDRVVYAAGFGTRELDSAAPVDENTLFAIGSTSKAFTAAALGMLVDEGRLSWDDAVTDHLPWFQLHDPWVTREIRVRELLTHVSGLPRGDYLWYGSGYPREEIVRRVRGLEPGWSFRSRYGYQNIMFLTAGEVLEEVTGRTWDEFVRARIFEPLGMRRTGTSVGELRGDANVATPHTLLDDAVHVVPYRDIDNIAPAGSINSSVRDLAQWIRMQLGRGSYEGRRLLSDSVVREMHAPQSLIDFDTDDEKLYPTMNFQAYGLAWSLQDHHGRKVVQHGGGIDGMAARVALMPEENVGVAVLSNLGGNGLAQALAFRVFDAYLGVPARDWSGLAFERAEASRQRAEARERELQAGRLRGTSPSLPLEAYAGTYESPLYGSLEVARDGSGLVLRFGREITADLEHWHVDTFRAVRRDPVEVVWDYRTFAEFDLGPDGRVTGIELEDVGRFERADTGGPQRAGGR